MVKIRLLCKCDLGENGDVVDVDKNGAKAMVDAGDAKYYQDEFEITKKEAIQCQEYVQRALRLKKNCEAFFGEKDIAIEKTLGILSGSQTSFLEKNGF